MRRLLSIILLSFVTLLTPPESGRLVLIGGASFPKEAVDWAYENVEGPTVVLSCYWTNPAKWNERLGGRSYTLIVLSSREQCNSKELSKLVFGAKVLCLDGGSQQDYIDLISGTLLEKTLNNTIPYISTISTSAGSMCLSEYVFSAKNGTAYSDVVRENPYDETVQLQTFLKIPLLKGLLIDTHFSERDRQDRLKVFLWRIRQDYGQKIEGFGIDESTALCISSTQTRVFGPGKVWRVN